MKWVEIHSGLHELTGETTSGKSVIAKINERRVSLEAIFLIPNIRNEIRSKTFTFGGAIGLLSTRYKNWKRKKELNKAKNW